MRSPLNYPLSRSVDTDVGGAADLQTDVMRFMAILLMCLVAIFALVQSMPLAPSAPAEVDVTPAVPIAPPLPVTAAPAEAPTPEVVEKTKADEPVDSLVVLKRPKWKPKPVPVREAKPLPPSPAPTEPLVEAVPEPPPPSPPVDEREGFTLRFESDTALLRLVAASQIGFYALEDNRARRMAVSESRVSFWDASAPNSFHEMESATVPKAVVDALARNGGNTTKVSWGVTLPGKLKSQLDGLMRQHSGGELIIEAGGTIRREAS